jgi:DNA (cytosine-5)-methyltransferase 1
MIGNMQSIESPSMVLQGSYNIKMPPKRDSGKNAVGCFIDLFAGCGGLSLGLMQAGWKGLFAVERDSIAFETLAFNFIDNDRLLPYSYEWPEWLKKAPVEISQFINEHSEQLSKMRGKVDLIAGGPPCQGFSMAGKRKSNDPRNVLFKHYVELVKLIQPRFLVLENVKGISMAFRKQQHDIVNSVTGQTEIPFSEQIKLNLEAEGYEVFTKLIRAMDVGVPQFRPRFIILAIRRDLLSKRSDFNPFQDFETQRRSFLNSKGLPTEHPITVGQAISDLETTGSKLIDCKDSPGFKQITYAHPVTVYQKLLHGEMNGTAPNSLRLANHRNDTKKRFNQILSTCRKGVQISASDRERFGMKKRCLVLLDHDQPSHTLTTLPDDFVHYSEPRILTVREYARLQSFPDWYEFRGKYTTGGQMRLKECPRYTQAGNAVPPFLAEFIGEILKPLSSELTMNPNPVKVRRRKSK